MYDLVATFQIALLLITGSGLGQPTQSSDDWDFATDPVRGLTIASVEYASGVSLSVQCMNGELTVGLVGLPASASAIRQFERQFDDGRIETWHFDGGSENSLVADSPRYARSLRAGGNLVLSAKPDGSPPVQVRLDLPNQSSNLDLVLLACGRALTTPLDSAPDLGSVLLVQAAVEIPPAAFRGHNRIQIVLDCLIIRSRLQSCQSESQTPSDQAAGDATARSANGTRVRVSDPTAAEGRWLQIVVTGQRFRR